MTPHLTLEIDRADRRYRPWEKLTGRVVIESDEPIKCDNTGVLLRLSSGGDATYETKDYDGQNVDLPFGVEVGRHTYPFELEIPGRPVTFRGKFLELDIAAVARIAPVGYGLIEVSTPIEVSADGSRRTFESSDRLGDPARAGCGVFISYVVAALIFSIGFILAVNGDPEPGPFFTILATFLAAATIAGPIYFWAKRNEIAAKKLGDFLYEIVPVHEDGRFFAEARLAITPNEPVTLNGILFEVEGVESSTVAFEGDEKARQREILLEHVEFASGAKLAAGERHEFDARIELPADAPTTFEMSWNRVFWDTTLKVDVDRGVDHVEHRRLEMMVARPTPVDETVLDLEESEEEVEASSHQYGDSGW